MSSFFPPQIGFGPTGIAGTRNTSTLYLGQNASVSWEAVGFGSDGRPDYLETLYINLSKVVANIPVKVATISFNVSGIQAIIAANSHAATPALDFQIREVDVCHAGIAKKMMILASLPYATGA